MSKINKDPKTMKKFARSFLVVLISAEIKLKIAKLIGRLLNQVNRAPVIIEEGESVQQKY